MQLSCVCYGFCFKLPHWSKCTEPVIWIHRPWNTPFCLSNREGDWSTPSKETESMSKCEAVPPKLCQGALPSHCRCSQYRNPSEIFQKTLSTWPTSSTGQNQQNVHYLSSLSQAGRTRTHADTSAFHRREKLSFMATSAFFSFRWRISSLCTRICQHTPNNNDVFKCSDSALRTKAPTAEKAVHSVSQIWSLILLTLKKCSIIIPLLVLLFWHPQKAWWLRSAHSWAKENGRHSKM